MYLFGDVFFLWCHVHIWTHNPMGNHITARYVAGADFRKWQAQYIWRGRREILWTSRIGLAWSCMEILQRSFQQEIFERYCKEVLWFILSADCQRRDQKKVVVTSQRETCNEQWLQDSRPCLTIGLWGNVVETFLMAESVVSCKFAQEPI